MPLLQGGETALSLPSRELDADVNGAALVSLRLPKDEEMDRNQPVSPSIADVL